ncbi:MAG TPA: hypothetical protein PJ994_07410 [Tepidiformaceae bacterium]|nr:hypothetical protein [Tepidiformaceae bacterium]
MDSADSTYAFRWARAFSWLLLGTEFLFVAGFVGMVFAVLTASKAWWLIFPAMLVAFAGVFVALFALGLRGAAVTIERDAIHVRFPTSMDTRIPLANIAGVALVNHGFWYGLGIRTNLVGHVALATAWGPSPELELRQPVRAGILPLIWWTHARSLRLTVEQPQEFVDSLRNRLGRTIRGVPE